MSEKYQSGPSKVIAQSLGQWFSIGGHFAHPPLPQRHLATSGGILGFSKWGAAVASSGKRPSILFRLQCTGQLCTPAGTTQPKVSVVPRVSCPRVVIVKLSSS